MRTQRERVRRATTTPEQAEALRDFLAEGEFITPVEAAVPAQATTDVATTVPGGNLDISSGTFAAWSPSLSVRAPLWAHSAAVTWSAAGVGPTGVGGGVWEYRCLLDGIAGNTLTTTPSSELTLVGTDTYTGFTAGTIAISIQARLTAGPNALRATTTSRFSFSITWKP